MPGNLRKTIYYFYLPLFRIYKRIQWLFYKSANAQIKIVLGAGQTNYAGWFSTDKTILDVTNEKQFQKYFSEKPIDNVLAEHVIEHLTKEQIGLMIENILKYSSAKLNIRIAVPDGFHPDKNYITAVKPGGSGEGADDHKHLFNYKSLSQIFEAHGLVSYLVEYWDENSKFHTSYSNDNNGNILRSSLNDSRNKNGKINYSSLIIDLKKE